jgi:hypothetical protein
MVTVDGVVVETSTRDNPDHPGTLVLTLRMRSCCYVKRTGAEVLIFAHLSGSVVDAVRDALDLLPLVMPPFGVR